jgi:PAS domain S-box-containing protein
MFSVLYVDDEPDLLEIGKLFLERLGDVTIDTAGSAYDGLKKITRLHYDAIVTDYEMPGMDGIELLKHLRSGGNDIPVIIFTGRGRESVAIEALNNGADFYLQKSGNIEAQYRELKNMIMQVARRRRSECAQAETESLYRLLFNKMNQGYALHEVILDETGSPFNYRFIEVNPEFERLMGTCREDCIGKTVRDLIPDIDPSWISRVGTVALTQEPVRFEDNTFSFGKYYDVSVFSPIKGKFAIVMEDITERKVYGDALQAANNKLNLLSSITRHDITNHLTVLLGYLELSKDQVLTPELSEHLTSATRAAETIARQIAFTKDYQDMGVLAPSWQNLYGVVNRVSDTVTLQHVTLDLGGQDVEIFADPLLERVFYNLIDNSLRYGAGMTKISIYPHVTPNGLNVVYEDNGAGIPMSDKSKIFEHGFGKNTGLGLFLAREILAITGMTIEETGMEGTGARFEIGVPLSNYRYPVEETEKVQSDMAVWSYPVGPAHVSGEHVSPQAIKNPLFEPARNK